MQPMSDGSSGGSPPSGAPPHSTAKPPADPWPKLIELPSPTPPKRPQWMYACAGVVVLAVGGAGLVVLSGRMKRRAEAELASRAYVLVDNATGMTAEVTIGDETVEVGNGLSREMRVPHGTYEAVARSGGVVIDRAPMTLVDRGAYGKWRGVYNIGGRARYMKIRVTYTASGRPAGNPLGVPGSGSTADDVVPFAVGQRVFELPSGTPTLDMPIYQRIFTERPGYLGTVRTFVCHVHPTGQSGCPHRPGNEPADDER
ncbi:MAG: hypothetical protein IT379_09010 [Deltaproteobacteria bacterium]|nr:hypothetical protein [Deltaproteobacteria bacterium]